MAVTDEFTNLTDEPAVRAEYAGKTEYATIKIRQTFPVRDADGLTLKQWLNDIGKQGVPLTAVMSVEIDPGSDDPEIIFEWEVPA